jgi:hypothetical protein
MVAPMRRIPVVAGLAYIERVRRLPSSFTATLTAEPNNRYFCHALAVLANGEKVGYVAPEIARQYFDAVVTRGTGDPIRCPGRRATQADHETSGVELLLDLTGVEITVAE